MLMVFFLSASIGAPSRLRKALPAVVDLILEGAFFQLSFVCTNFFVAVSFLTIVRQCWFEVLFAFQVYQRSAEIDCGNVHFVNWLL